MAAAEGGAGFVVRMQLSASVFLFSEGGASVISNAVHELNEEIRDKEIRLIGETGEQLGICPPQREALHIADERGLDLVKISPQAMPPYASS